MFVLHDAASFVDAAYRYADLVGDLLGATEPLPELDELIVGDYHSVPSCSADRFIPKGCNTVYRKMM